MNASKAFPAILEFFHTRGIMTKFTILRVFITLYLTWKSTSCRTFRDFPSIYFSTARLQEIDSIVSCVYNLSFTYSSGRNLIFISEQLETDLSESLVRKVNGQTKIISSVSSTSQSTGFFVLFHSHKDTTHVDILEKIPPNDVVRFAVVLDFQEKINLRRIQKILEEFWSYQIIDIIVVVPYSISGNIRIYTYYPFSPIRCGETGPPVLINIWNSHVKTFLNKNDLFSRIKKVSTGIVRICSSSYVKKVF